MFWEENRGEGKSKKEPVENALQPHMGWLARVNSREICGIKK